MSKPKNLRDVEIKRNIIVDPNDLDKNSSYFILIYDCCKMCEYFNIQEEKFNNKMGRLNGICTKQNYIVDREMYGGAGCPYKMSEEKVGLSKICDRFTLRKDLL